MTFRTRPATGHTWRPTQNAMICTAQPTTGQAAPVPRTAAALRRAGADVAAIGALLAESDAWRLALGEDSGLVQTLGQIPLFRRGPHGEWVPHHG